MTPGREGLQVMLGIAGIGELPGIVEGGALGGPGVSVSPGALVAVRVDDRQMALLGTTAPPATG